LELWGPFSFAAEGSQKQPIIVPVDTFVLPQA